MRAQFFVLAIVFLSHSLYSQEKTFVKEYTYKASEADSKVSCRAIATNQLRSMLLNELGVYVESNQLLKTDEVAGKNSQDFIENISTISAGITKLDVLGETWNGDTFWMKAAITVDTTSLQQSLKRISEDHQKVKELEDLKQRLSDANQKLVELTEALNNQKELDAKAALTEKYNAKVNELSASNLMYNAKAKFDSKDYYGAIDDFSRVIALDPTYALPYAYRGHAKVKVHQYQEAVADFNRAVELKPNFDAAYVDRGYARSAAGDNEGAITDFTRAITISPNYSIAYSLRGEAHMKLKNYRAAIGDFDFVIHHAPDYATAYLSRGIAKNSLGLEGACSDWSKAAKLDCTEAFDLLRKYCK
jgi:tetratricopeptide (TPR) repeat protein